MRVAEEVHRISEKNRRIALAQVLQRSEPILQEILAQCAIKHGGMLIDDLLPPSRSQLIIDALHEYYYRAITETTASLQLVAKLVARDHTSLLYGVARHATHHHLPMPREMDNGRYYRKRQAAKNAA
jgi:chromosomal replication initiation ATPase DnaA